MGVDCMRNSDSVGCRIWWAVWQSEQTGAFILPAAMALPCAPSMYSTLILAWQVPQVLGLLALNVGLLGLLRLRMLCEPWQLWQLAATSRPSLFSAKPWIESTYLG